MEIEHGRIRREHVDAITGSRISDRLIKGRCNHADAVDAIERNVRVPKPDGQIGCSVTAADNRRGRVKRARSQCEKSCLIQDC